MASYSSAFFLLYTASSNVHVCVPGTHTDAISSVLPGGSEPDRGIQQLCWDSGCLVLVVSLRKTSSPTSTFELARTKRAVRQRSLSCKLKICFMANPLLCFPSWAEYGKGQSTSTGDPALQRNHVQRPSHRRGKGLFLFPWLVLAEIPSDMSVNICKPKGLLQSFQPKTDYQYSKSTSIESVLVPQWSLIYSHCVKKRINMTCFSCLLTSFFL